MGLDGVVIMFFLPVIIGVIAFLVIGLKAKSTEEGKGVLKIGIKRLAFGYIGVTAAMALYAIIEASILGLKKVEQGHIVADKLLAWIPGGSLYYFVIFETISIILLSALGLPLFYLTSKIRLGSIAGTIIIALAISVVYSAIIFANPYNIWCASNIGTCTIRALIGAGIPSVIAALGFGLGARLPLVKSRG